MKITLYIFLSVLFFSNSYAQNLKPDHKLENILHNTIKGFNGDIGIYVENLKTHKFVDIQADTLFPTASMVKIPILIGTFSDILNKKFNYNDTWIYRDSLKYDDGITGSLKDSTKMTVSEIIWMMETLSDNTASLWLQGVVGSERINELMDSLGFYATKLNSRTLGRDTQKKKYGWGVTSPREMATILKNCV